MRSVITIASLTIGVVLGAGACAKGAPGTRIETGPQVERGLEQLRAATRSFQSLDTAVAAGYARDVANCLVHEHHGAMGYHHTNAKYMDAKAEVERPEILLYERLPDGRYRLNGAEFIVPYRAWARDTIAPTIMGQPMKREDNLKFWYLHVWAWTPNREGVFADFHPDVQCAAGASKIFRPYTAPPSPGP